jgi:Phage protein (N4 Gp49/phage Sf6 gene 66) family
VLVSWAGDGPEELPEALQILTLCIVVTSTGFTLVGKSAPADPENFDADLGSKLAYEDVLKQL